jgi:hypothetical protein
MSETPQDTTDSQQPPDQAQPEQQAAPTQQDAQPGQQAAVEPTYSVDDLAAAATSLGCQPWDVAGIFSVAGVTEMTMTDFQSALQHWQTTPINELQAGG